MKKTLINVIAVQNRSCFTEFLLNEGYDLYNRRKKFGVIKIIKTLTGIKSKIKKYLYFRGFNENF